ncbi:MAG: 2-amino-4-hydroxy-6-hydroxymethyldihydropteridine diphosphokinase, partial [Flavobacteriaceae bacterium]
MHTIYLSLGSNLGHRHKNLQKAIFGLNNGIGTITAVSRIYESASWGFDSSDFLNASVELQTTLSPPELMQRILAVEEQLGRVRDPMDGYMARTIDIDILYYDTEVIATKSVLIPHPKIGQRLFVLKPLADIAPQFYHPVLKKDTRNLIQQCKDHIVPKRMAERLFLNKEALFSHIQFISFEGNIGVGKTTLATRFAHEFNAKLVLERFADNPFLPNFYKDPDRYAFPLEMSFLAERYQQFADDTTQFDLFKSFMVSDYDIHKSLIFAKVTLQNDEFELYRKLFRMMYQQVKKPKIYVFLYQTVERLLQNI